MSKGVRKEEYKVLPPLRYGTFEGDAPIQKGKAIDGRQAMIVCHGMGQQVPFKTLSDVASGLQKDESSVVCAARQVEIGSERLGRLELTVNGKDRAREVDVYEVYWAPITEGRVTFRDTLSFLFGAALRGFQIALRRGRHQRFGRLVPIGGARHIGMIALVLVQVLAILALTVATSLLSGGAMPGYGSFKNHDAALLSMLIFLVPAGLFVLALLTRLPILGWPTLALLMIATPVAAVTVWLQMFIPSLVPSVLDLSALSASTTAGAAVAPVEGVVESERGLSTGLILGVMLVVAYYTRRFAITYVGDVAAYVAPHKLDRFSEVRTRIKDCARRVGDAVYGAVGPDGRLLYDNVSVVGRSLGSVVAYDLVNGLILKDEAMAPKPDGAQERRPLRDVASRTKMLLTFGSPLDKISWFFRSHAPDRDHQGREILAASMQPLIVDYAYRPFRWVNVYAPADPISGPLDLYDDPDPANEGHRVENVRDQRASFPLHAHTRYWKNPQVWKCLREGLFDAVHDGCPVRASHQAPVPQPAPGAQSGQEPA